MKKDNFLIFQSLREQKNKFIDTICEQFDLEKQKVIEDLIELEIFEFSDSETRDTVIRGKLNQKLTDWYDSLKAGKPDYTIYDGYYSLIACWLCWNRLSRTYVKRIYGVRHKEENYLKKLDGVKPTIFDGVKVLVDFGCGIGFSTIALAEVLFTVKAYGINVKDSWQLQFAKTFNKKKDVRFISSMRTLPDKVDLAFCSEYFEHFEEPVRHLQEIIDRCSPRIFIIANGFPSVAMGHFEYFIVDKERVHCGRMARIFNKALVDRGYERKNLGFWNNRPNVWEKK